MTRCLARGVLIAASVLVLVYAFARVQRAAGRPRGRDSDECLVSECGADGLPLSAYAG